MPSQIMLEGIRRHIIPLIMDSVSDACDAYDATRQENGDNYSDAYSFGTTGYAILKNRLRALLPEDSGFVLEIFNNVLRITWSCADGAMSPCGDGFFRFFVYKVDMLTRLPKGGASVKAELRDKWQQGWLFPKAEARAIAPDGFVNNLGYDASIDGGFGSVTLDRIRHVSGSDYEVRTLHRFELDHADFTRAGTTSRKLAPEKIQRVSLICEPPLICGLAGME